MFLNIFALISSLASFAKLSTLSFVAPFISLASFSSIMPQSKKFFTKISTSFAVIVFFAVKKNVKEIKREDFKNPQREDMYGTSVMGIQFNREGLCTVSIKNRYNHTVNNPDATYGNNLDRIVPGLTQSFAILLDREYGLRLNDFNQDELEIPNYVVACDGRYYKYNMEVAGKYYCPGNIIISGGDVKSLEKSESQILMDYFIFDIKDKFIKVYDEIEKGCCFLERREKWEKI